MIIFKDDEIDAISFLFLVMKIGVDTEVHVTYAGRYGTCIKLQRKRTFMAMSVAQWLLLRKRIPSLAKKDFSVELSTRKDVTNTVMAANGVTYIQFRSRYTDADGAAQTSYINLRPHEWAEFLAQVLPKMDELFPPMSVDKCSDCAMEVIITPVNDMGRSKESQLTAEELQAVEDNNEVAYNQQMHRCTYCGGYDYSLDEECHCHRVDCRACEPKNFCGACGKLMVLVV